MTRRDFITLSAVAVAAGASLLSACGQGGSLVTKPVTEAESIAASAPDAVSAAINNTDYPCENVTAAVNQLEADIAGCGGPEAVMDLTNAFYEAHPAAGTTYHNPTKPLACESLYRTFTEQTVPPEPELPCVGAVEAQQVVNDTVRLAKIMYGDDFEPDGTIDVVAESARSYGYDKAGNELTRSLWNVYVLAQSPALLAAQNDTPLWICAQFDAITGQLGAWILYRQKINQDPEDQTDFSSYHVAEYDGYVWCYQNEAEYNEFAAAGKKALAAIGIEAEPVFPLSGDMKWEDVFLMISGEFAAASNRYSLMLNEDLGCIEILEMNTLPDPITAHPVTSG